MGDGERGRVLGWVGRCLQCEPGRRVTAAELLQEFEEAGRGWGAQSGFGQPFWDAFGVDGSAEGWREWMRREGIQEGSREERRRPLGEGRPHGQGRPLWFEKFF